MIEQGATPEFFTGAESLGLWTTGFLAFSLKLKRAVRREQDNICDCCGEQVDKLQVHHRIPQCMGGGDEIENAVGLCDPCHTQADFEALELQIFYPKVHE